MAESLSSMSWMFVTALRSAIKLFGWTSRSANKDKSQRNVLLECQALSKTNPGGLFKTAFVMNELHSKETKVHLKKTKVNLEKHSYVSKNTGLSESAFACAHSYTLPFVHLPAFSGEHTSFKMFSLYLHLKISHGQSQLYLKLIIHT